MLRRSVYRIGATITVAGFLILGLLGGSGCTSGSNNASAAQERSTSAIKSISDLKTEAWNARTLVDETMATLNSLSTTDDLNASFKRYSEQVDQVNEQAEKIKSLTSDMKDNVHTYIKQWQEDMAKVDDPALVQLADQRRAAVQQRYTEVQKDHQAFSDSYATFYGDLTSLRSYLANDLTAAGVKSAQTSIKKANDDRNDMKEKAEALLKVLHEVAAGMRTPTPA
jgi:hypothetical protein